jgi:ubiquinone/menaquinone biosynthesis C-methylase UbiE
MPINWHERFTQQAIWTRQLRKHIFQKINFSEMSSVLEVGCGTGAILSDLYEFPAFKIFGVDINKDYLQFTSSYLQRIHLLQGDAHYIPLKNKIFDVSICHYLLLWVESPEIVLCEMLRVTKSGGYVIAFAEPDYGGRIIYPYYLSEYGHYQELSLKEHGADPQIGRKLSSLFHHCGLIDIETGILGAEWKNKRSYKELIDEYSILINDIHGFIKLEDEEKIEKLLYASWVNNELVMFIPTFYAFGKAP